jgi:elongation factor 3
MPSKAVPLPPAGTKVVLPGKTAPVAVPKKMNVRVEPPAAPTLVRPSIPPGATLPQAADLCLKGLAHPDVDHRTGAAAALGDLAKGGVLAASAADATAAACGAAASAPSATPPIHGTPPTTGIAVTATGSGILELMAAGVMERLESLASSPEPAGREGAWLGLAALARRGGRAAEPSLAPWLLRGVRACGDRALDVRTAAGDAARVLATRALHPAAYASQVPALLARLDDPAILWQEKAAALDAVRRLAGRASTAATASLPTLVPAVWACLADARTEVATAARKAMQAALALVGNRDLAPAVPAILSCMARPGETPECVTKVSGTTFVQPVEAPALAVLVPLLVRGLRSKHTPTVRKTAVIATNMSKLVYNPSDAHAFFPVLNPLFVKAAEETSNPEARGVVEGAVEALSAAEAKAGAAPPERAWPPGEAEAGVSAAVQEAVGGAACALSPAVLSYCGALASSLASDGRLSPGVWADALAAVLAPHVGGSEEVAEAASRGALARAKVALAALAGPGGTATGDDADEYGDELCDCEFSLAYGGKILLSGARMRLLRGARYGLCGANGVGKSTLLRAIADGKVDGFPPRASVRTAFVESNIDAEGETSVGDYMYDHPELVALGDEPSGVRPDRPTVDRVLGEVGFDAAGRAAPISTLSGGWKMKLAVARAMLLDADIMLLDEPTNHLDVANVAWLQEYLTNNTRATSLIVSHDSGFLDTVCTHILHYHAHRLTVHRGNLSAFVDAYPPARSYYDLAAAADTMVFPLPGILVGVTSRERAILKMRGVQFQYPTAPKPQLDDVDVTVCLSSRIAVTGPNGAGKTTLIRMLTGESAPSAGTVWKHPNLRVAYVAQHAFHHVERHLDDTPLAYLQWRYGSGEDKEALEKATRQVSAEEAALMAKAIMGPDGVPRIVEALVGRRKLKSSFEYEVKWKDTHHKKNAWMARDALEAAGFSKAIADVDTEEATRAALMGPGAKEFTTSSIIKHLGDFGLDAEFAAHSAIRGLSGGQKVKVVLAAAVWNCPHVIVLDEPTNFLDRDALGALARGLRAFTGGVVIISHNAEFTGEVCDETWAVGGGTVSATRPERLLAAGADAEAKTVSVFLKRSASSGNNLASAGGSGTTSVAGEPAGPLEGAELDAAFLEAERLKAEKRDAARVKKEAKELAAKLKAARRF